MDLVPITTDVSDYMGLAEKLGSDVAVRHAALGYFLS